MKIFLGILVIINLIFLLISYFEEDTNDIILFSTLAIINILFLLNLKSDL